MNDNNILSINFSAPLAMKEYIQPLRDYCHRSVQCFDGSKSWYDASLKSEAEDCDGNQEVSFKKGNKYEDLLQIFRNDIPHNRIIFEKSVSKIDYTDTDNVQVLTKDGNIWSADVVIFTGSLGVLKQNGRNLFDPQLPDDKLQAIDTLGFGLIDKIYLEFSDSILDPSVNWNFLFIDKGISYSEKDAANDWTRFLIESNVVNARLTSLWLSGIPSKPTAHVASGLP